MSCRECGAPGIMICPGCELLRIERPDRTGRPLYPDAEALADGLADGQGIVVGASDDWPTPRGVDADRDPHHQGDE